MPADVASQNLLREMVMDTQTSSPKKEAMNDANPDRDQNTNRPSSSAHNCGWEPCSSPVQDLSHLNSLNTSIVHRFESVSETPSPGSPASCRMCVEVGDNQVEKEKICRKLSFSTDPSVKDAESKVVSSPEDAHAVTLTSGNLFQASDVPTEEDVFLCEGEDAALEDGVVDEPSCQDTVPTRAPVDDEHTPRKRSFCLDQEKRPLKRFCARGVVVRHIVNKWYCFRRQLVNWFSVTFRYS